MKQLLTLSLLFMLTLTASAQVKTYHVETTSDGNRAVSAFIPFEAKNSEAIFANTLLWTVEHICPQLREGIKEVDVPNKSIKCDWTLASDPNSGSKNKYYCKATFRVLDNKFIFYISDIQIESSILLSKKITPIKRLDPDKKKAHQEMMEDFEQTISSALNELINYIGKHEMSLLVAPLKIRELQRCSSLFCWVKSTEKREMFSAHGKKPVFSQCLDITSYICKKRVRWKESLHRVGGMSTSGRND